MVKMNRLMLGAMLFLVLLVSVSGCTRQTAPNGQDENFTQNVTEVPEYVRICLASCNNTKNMGDTQALEMGYCLLDPIPTETDWVCDIAHTPRQAVDYSPNNQCQSYLKGLAHHFVEVSPECRLIRAV